MVKVVTVYTSNSCSYCKVLKMYLEARGITYKEKNINDNNEYMLELVNRNIMSVPVIIIDDNVVIGFKKDEIEKLLS